MRGSPGARARTRRSSGPVRARRARGRGGGARPGGGGRRHRLASPRSSWWYSSQSACVRSMTSCGVIRPASISWKVWPIVCSMVGDDQSGNSVRPPSSTSLLPPLLHLRARAGRPASAVASVAAGTCWVSTSACAALRARDRVEVGRRQVRLLRLGRDVHGQARRADGHRLAALPGRHVEERRVLPQPVLGDAGVPVAAQHQRALAAPEGRSPASASLRALNESPRPM